MNRRPWWMRGFRDGSRVNAIIPPASIDGPSLSIRRFAVDPLEMEDLITLKSLTVGDRGDSGRNRPVAA